MVVQACSLHKSEFIPNRPLGGLAFGFLALHLAFSRSLAYLKLLSFLGWA